MHELYWTHIVNKGFYSKMVDKMAALMSYIPFVDAITSYLLSVCFSNSVQNKGTL